MSGSEHRSEAFDLLNPSIQKWVWQQEWDHFRDIQERAIPILNEAKKDVIIASATASGKTEAAMLPVLSRALDNRGGGLFAVYVGPLKALINDQLRRFKDITRNTDLKITPWHGDVPSRTKRNLLHSPSGVLLITPESLESIFVNNGTKISNLFGSLSYVIIDELHSFIGNERGRHLSSLLERLELTLNNRITRIGLSATLGDREIAKRYLRRKAPDAITYIESETSESALKLQLRGYLNQAPKRNADYGQAKEEDTGYADYEIGKHLFRVLRGKDNLIFANSRMNVEKYADRLRQFSNKTSVPNEFWPHHGSLSKGLREDIESQLKDGNRPSTAVCTTTLEMGIDIGTVESIAQIGCPPSVASMRQRLGRSGRRDNPSILRIYIQEEEITEETAPQDHLRVELFQCMAMTELLLEKWIEPPSLSRIHLSTLIHQLLSLIGQYGGFRAVDAWTILFEKGPFSGISKEQFKLLLKKLGEEEILTQANDKTLTFGIKGENIVDHYSFYAAFNTPDEYKIVAEGKTIGSIPIVFPLVEGIYIIFAGRRWIITSVDQEHKVIFLNKSSGGKPPSFGGSGILIHNKIRERMLELYTSQYTPTYLNKQAKELLQEGRKYFNVYNLSDTYILESGNDVILFIWRGSIVQNTVMLLLRNSGLNVALEGVSIHVRDTSKEMVLDTLSEILESAIIAPEELVNDVKNKENEKFDYLLPDELLNLEYHHRFISIDDAYRYLEILLSHTKKN